MQKLVFFTVLAVLSFGSKGGVADPIAWPGKACASIPELLDCETPTTGLRCLDPSKGCQCEGDKVFHFGTVKKCLLPEGSPCNGDPAELTPNSECNTAIYKVQCKTGYLATESKRCVNPHGDCRQHYDCDEDKFQLCDIATNKCECDADSDPNGDKVCELKAGKVCTSKPFPVPECHEYSTCTKEKCVCISGLESNPNGQCRLSHGGDCSGGDENLCDETVEFLECSEDDKRCRCSGEGITSLYDPASKRCFLGAGATCSVTSWPPCAPKSSCYLDINTCVCNKGLDKGVGLNCVVLHGHPCQVGTADECDAAGFMKCDDAESVCSCINKDKMIHRNGMCNIKVGNPCSGSGQGPTCVSNAICNSGLCSCAAGLIETPSGECLGDFGSACGDAGQAECSAEKFLSCNAITKKCECGGVNEAWYNTESKMCELLVNEACQVGAGSQPCTHNSTCDATRNKCTCDSGLVASKDRTSCFETIGAPCTSDSNCNQERHLVCIEGKCSCDENSWYNPKSMRCELLAGSPCINDPDSESCTDFSACEGMKCSCLEGYEESFAGKCVATIGAPCGRDGDAECNPDEFLTCVGGKCSCDLDSWFNPHTAQCQLLAGSTCSVGERDQRCTDFSTCEGSVCKCDSEYVSTNDGKCAKEYGASCVKSDSECADFLVCEANKCACNFDAWYNIRTRRCELLAGEFCTPGSGQQSCSEFSDCSREGSTGGYTCHCIDGFHLSGEKRCVHFTCDYDSIQNWLGRRVTRWNY